MEVEECGPMDSLSTATPCVSLKNDNKGTWR
jgi:hypothetical protein